MNRTDEIKEELIEALIEFIEDTYDIEMAPFRKKVLRLIVERQTANLQSVSKKRFKNERSFGEKRRNNSG